MSYSMRYGCIHKIGKKTNNKCHICHGEAHPDDYGSPAGYLGGDATTVDHLIPQSHGGDDDPDNLLLAHARCNSRRGTMSPELARLKATGTTLPPLSRAEEVVLQLVKRRQQNRDFGIGALIAVGVAVLGGIAWQLIQNHKEAKDAAARKAAKDAAARKAAEDATVQSAPANPEGT